MILISLLRVHRVRLIEKSGAFIAHVASGVGSVFGLHFGVGRWFVGSALWSRLIMTRISRLSFDFGFRDSLVSRSLLLTLGLAQINEITYNRIYPYVFLRGWVDMYVSIRSYFFIFGGLWGLRYSGIRFCACMSTYVCCIVFV